MRVLYRFCFEIVATGKKGTKKYGFSVDSDGSRRRWLSQLRKASNQEPPAVQSDTTGNPMAAGGEAGEVDPEDDPESGFAAAFRFKKSEQAPAGKEGYLMKKSPNLMTGWQKRYFVLKAPGEISYYENVRLSRFFCWW